MCILRFVICLIFYMSYSYQFVCMIIRQLVFPAACLIPLGVATPTSGGGIAALGNYYYAYCIRLL
jgi:hypothetical protein